MKRSTAQLSVQQILGWADAYYARNGKWPRTRSGSIRDARDETWHKIDRALAHGFRGLPGGRLLRKLVE
jgi:hypothetical protein